MGRDAGERRREPDEQIAKPDEDQHESHGDRQDERSDLASGEARGPHTDAGESGREQCSAGVLGDDRPPRHM